MTNQELFILLTSGASLLSALLGAGIAMGMFKQKVTATAKDLEKLEARIDKHDEIYFPYINLNREAIEANRQRINELMSKIDPLVNDVSKIKVHIEWLVKEYKAQNGSR